MDQTATETEPKANPDNLIDEIIRMADYAFERLPMLEIIAERAALTLSDSVPALSGALCEVTFTGLDYVPMLQAIEDMPEAAFFAVCEGAPFDGRFLLSLDSAFVLTTMELMLGGQPSSEETKANNSFTAIERRFSATLTEVVLTGLQTGFGIVSDVALEMSKPTTDLEPTPVTQSANLCVRLNFNLVQAGQVGNLQVVMPYEMFGPLHGKLSHIYYGERSDTGNQAWRRLLVEQIERANVEIEAELTTVKLSLNDIMQWRSGDQFNLWIDDRHEATVILNGKPSFHAELGKRQSGNTAIKITEKIETEEGYEDGHDRD